MQIAVSGKFSTDHFDTAFASAEKIRGIAERADLSAIETDLSGFVFFPVIISDKFGLEKKSLRSFSRKENAEFVNQEIDANDWSVADEGRRLEMMMDALEEAIRSTRSSRINDQAKDTIIAALRTAMAANGS